VSTVETKSAQPESPGDTPGISGRGYRILEKNFLNDQNTVFEMVMEAPQLARKARGGNFVMVRLHEQGERIPLTIGDYDREKGTVTIAVLVVGKTTKEMSLLKAGDRIYDLVGPLGKEAHTHKFPDPVVVVGGGVGIAAVYPQAKELHESGNHVISIIGARNTKLLFWREKMKAVSDELIITTDDGSEGKKGFVTDALREIIKTRKLSRIIAIGPLIMMKMVAKLTAGVEGLPKVETWVSLNPIMIDGTGMCGGCRFSTLGHEMKYACVDGPDVDGHDVDFENLMKRNSRFRKQEQESMHSYESCLATGGKGA
jgi:ferredoxin--NADP+ reductase